MNNGGGGSGIPVPAGGTAGSVPYILDETPSGGVQGTWLPALAGAAGRTVTGASDTVVATDRSTTILYNYGSAVATALTSCSTLGSNFAFAVQNEGAGSVTFTPADHNIYPSNGSNTLVLAQGQNAVLNCYDNNNWLARAASGQIAAGSNITLTPTANGVSIAASGGGSSGTVTSVNGSNGVATTTGSAFTTSGTLILSQTTNSQTAAYNPVAADCGNIIKMSVSSNVAMAFPQAGSTGFPSGCAIKVINNNGGGLLSITTTTSVFNYNGSAGRTYWFQGIDNTATYTSDGSNWSVQTDFPQLLFTNKADSCLSAVATANQTIGYTGSTVSCVAQFSGVAAFSTGSFTLPANILNSGTLIRIVDQFAATTGGTNEAGAFDIQTNGNNTLATATGAVFFCGASASITNCVASQEFIINGTAAPGSSVAVAISPGARAALNLGSVNGGTWFSNVATNNNIAVTQKFGYSATQTGNWADLFGTDVYWVHY